MRHAANENDALREALAGAATPEERVQVANEHGFDPLISDLPAADEDQELSDAELANASGGYTFPRTDWIYCDNPWTNYWCSLRC